MNGGEYLTYKFMTKDTKEQPAGVVVHVEVGTRAVV